jgi:hypothetical protein
VAAKKKTRKSSDKPMTKTGFIRSLSPEVPADEVIAKAKEQGIELKKKLVWTTQSEMRTGGNSSGRVAPKARRSAKKRAIKRDDIATATSEAAPAATATATGKKPGPKKGFRKAAAKAAAAAPAKATNGATAEQKLRALVIELGTERADRVYRAVKSQLDAIVSGA